MKMELKTFCDIKAISIIKDFVIATGKYFGANHNECKDLELATEEAAVHIISNHPAGSKEHFEISCEGSNGTLKIILSNKGVPVNKENIPVYMIENPEDSFDGLQFFLIKKLTDKFYFHNCGAEGWQTILEKKISKFINNTSNNETEIQNLSSKEKLTVSLAVPENAYEITKLAYFTYRYSYAKIIFYYPEILKESIENHSIISFVVKTKTGTIVGHSAYIRSPYCHEIVEAGGMMTMPEFRKTTGMLRLVKKQYNYPYEEDIGAKIVESNLITAHTGSQRITRSFKFKPMALKISVHSRADFLGIDEINNQRETLLYSIWAPFPLEPITIFIPKIHYDITKKLIDNSELPIEIKTLIKDSLPENTTYDIEKKLEEGLATIILESLGDNWNQSIKKLTRNLNIEGFKTIHLKIPIWEKLPKKLDDDLTSLGFFFSGIIPKTPKKWFMIYTYLNNQKIDFEKINLCDDIAILLRNYIETRVNHD